MELEEMKSVWAEMSGQIEKQKRITDKLIITMTQERYKRSLNSVGIPEKIATVLCVGFVMMIVVNFDKYQNAWVITCAFTSIALLIVLPFLSLRSIHKMNNLDVQGNNMKQTLIDFNKYKNEWLSIQRWSYYLAPFFMIAVLPVMLVIMGADESKLFSSFWLWYLPVWFGLFIIISRWVYQHYVKTMVRTESVLKELEE